MLTRDTLLNHLRSLDGVRNPEGDIYVISVGWDGVPRLQDVTIEFDDECFTLYSPIANADEIESALLRGFVSSFTLPERFNLCLYEFWPPNFYWCLSFTSGFSGFGTIEDLQAEVTFLAEICDVLESKISDSDSL